MRNSSNILLAVVFLTVILTGCTGTQQRSAIEKKGKEAIRADRKLSQKEEQRKLIKTKIMTILEEEGGENYNSYDMLGVMKMKKEIYSMGDEAVPVLLEVLKEIDDGRDGYLIIPLFIGKRPSFKGDQRIIPGLIEIVQDGSHNGRIWAADTLGRLRAKEALDILIETLDDEDEGVRDSAVRALGEIGDKKAEAPLIKIIQDGSGLGIRALGKISDDKTLISTLFPLYEKSRNPHMITRTDRGLKRQVDRNKYIRISIIDVLAKINRPEMVDFFIKELEIEKDNYVKGEILTALGKMKESNKAKENLIKYLKSTNEVLRFKASKALKNLTGKDYKY